MSTSIIYGYGFELGTIKPLVLIDFIKNHKNTFCKSDEEIEMFENLTDTDNGIFAYTYAEDYFEDYMYSCDCSGQEGLGAVISNIMYRETEIRFEYQKGQSDCGSEPSILLTECCPWGYNEIERNLTKDDLYKICKMYMDELEITDDPDYLNIEYFG
jgi:hypothetical protein